MRILKFIVNLFSWLLGICFSVALFVGLGFMIYHGTVYGFNRGQEFAYQLVMEHDSYDVEFVLEENTSVADVAQMLEEQGIIDNAWLYRFEIMLIGSPDDYEPGTFMLNQNLSPSQINARLRAQPVEPMIENRIRIREGWSQQDIAIYLEDRGFFTAEEFMYVANNHDFGFSFLDDLPDRPSRLEGYLFPDTYFVSEHPTPVEVIMNMLVRFNEIYNFEYRLRTEEMGLTIDQVVNIASMIEKEVRVPEERPMVARVIYNRLERGMRLQIDATVWYALETHRDWQRLLYVDLEVDSPYNTYRVVGLPLGPISNPSAASIHAALFPAEGNWLFYVLVDGETGAHFFTDSYDEHLYMRANHMPRPWEDDE